MKIPNPTEKELTETMDIAENPVNELKESFKASEKKPAIYSIAKHLIEKHNVKTIRGKVRELLVYKEGIYTPGEDILKMDVRLILEELCSTHYSKEIIETAKDLTLIDRKETYVDINLINLNNGTLNILTGEFKEHSPQNIFLSKLPIDFTKEADCPIIKRYLSDVLDQEQINIIQEWLGYGLYREYFIKKAIIFVGEGDTGKTTLICLSNSFYGENNVSGVSLQKISSDKFAPSQLYGKYINLYDELSFKNINDNGAFKIATGGGIITGEKKFGDQFQFKNFSKLTFACNKIPDVKDTNDDAYFKRWIIIEFNRFIGEEKQDKPLIHKMTTQIELSGLLNFALEGLHRLLKNQKFTYDKDASEIKEIMLRSGSVVARFGYDCLEEEQGEWISKSDMYEAFTQYASKHQLPSTSEKEFGSRFPLCVSYVAQYKPRDPKDSSKQITAWRNVRFKVGEGVPKEKDPFDMIEDEPEITELFTLTDQIS